MQPGGEQKWFARKAQELVDTQAAEHGPDLIATLPDNTTYSVLGDHGGIQRSSQRIPIVFGGANLSATDLRAQVRSVDIMPTILKAMGITPTFTMDGKRLHAAPDQPLTREHTAERGKAGAPSLILLVLVACLRGGLQHPADGARVALDGEARRVACWLSAGPFVRCGRAVVPTARRRPTADPVPWQQPHPTATT